MKNATGISKWTSANRNHAVHIMRDIQYLNMSGKETKGTELLCKKSFFSTNTDVFDIDKVTCKKCINEYNKMNEDKEVCVFCKSPNIIDADTCMYCVDCNREFV